MSDKQFAKSYKRHLATMGASAAITYGGNIYGVLKGKNMTAFNIGTIVVNTALGYVGSIKISEMAKRIGVKDWGTLRKSFNNYGFGLNNEGKDATKKMYEYLRKNK